MRAKTQGSVQRIGWTLTVGAGVGLVMATILLLEKIALLRDPSYVPSCSINPVLSCGSVMTTPQAEAFGLPNPVLGVIGFSMVTTIGVAVLAGARPARWFWRGLQTGVTAGMVFVHWLIIQSLYYIGALCPYCMIVWIVTIALFTTVTAHNVRSGSLPAPAAVSRATPYAPTIAVAWTLTIAGLIAVRFWDYWSMALRTALPSFA